MPPQARNKHQKRSKEPIDMAECVLPDDIMLCILTRLPVKSLIRFKSVCKPWRELFASPEFMKMHRHQFSSNPKNESLIIYCLSEDDVDTMSVLNTDKMKPTNLDLPNPQCFPPMYYVGCCNGLVCISFVPYGKGIAIWNPALRLSKFVPLEIDEGIREHVSLGFGYDADGDDFKVVRIVRFRKRYTEFAVEVYSAKLDTWEIIKASFHLRVLRVKNDAIVNGNPYWVAKVYEIERVRVENGEVSLFREEIGEVLVGFDVTKLELKMVPLSTLKQDEGAEVQFVEWKDSIAALVCTENEHGVESVGVWVFDEGEMIWRLSLSFGPIETSVYRCLQCSKNGKIVGECIDGKLFVFDPESECVKVIQMNKAWLSSFEIYGYNESLTYIEGMTPV